jgi:hypothetical protein
VTEQGRRKLPGSTGIEVSRRWAPVTPGHAHVGGCFADAVGPAFKANGHAPPFLIARWA